MSKSKEPDYAEELKKDFDRWEHLYQHGGSDPCWSDGCNLRLVRNHILYGKAKIEANFKPSERPEIYYRKTPPEVDSNYMARADEIRQNAKKTLEIYKANEDYQYLLSETGHLNKQAKKEILLDNVLGYARGLETAIQQDDLIWMRRHEKPDIYLESFRSCAKKAREIKPPAQEQLGFI